MNKINLYRYTYADGSSTITTKQREETDEVYAYRLVADEGKAITNGDLVTYCIDTHNPDDWTDCEAEDEKNES